MAADIVQKIVFSVLAANVGDSTAAVDVPQDGFIESIFADTRGAAMDAQGDSYSVELSFASSNTFANNDARISIMEINEVQNFLTSGGSASGKNVYLFGLNIPVFAGERLHVHTAVAGGTSAVNVTLYLYHRTRSPAPPRRSARRR